MKVNFNMKDTLNVKIPYSSYTCSCVSCEAGYKFETDQDGNQVLDINGNGICVVDILAGNPHGGVNCVYYGLDADQRGETTDVEFREGGKLTPLEDSYDEAEQAWRLSTATDSTTIFHWVGWVIGESATFADREFRATFQAKFLSSRADLGNDGLLIYTAKHDQWLKDGIDNVGTYVSADVVTTVPNLTGERKVLLIFDGAPVDVLIKDFVMSVCD